jgi:hypothetical protein
VTESNTYGGFIQHRLKENSGACRIEIWDDRFGRKANGAGRPNINLK